MDTLYRTGFLGDQIVLTLPLKNEDGTAFTPGTTYSLIFTAKLEDTDADSAAILQLASGAGIVHSGSNAICTINPAATLALDPQNLVFDIQAQNVTTGEVIRTVAYGRLQLRRDVTRQTTTSVPVFTSAEPVPFSVAIADAVAGLVSLTGGQTISGYKTFTAPTTFDIASANTLSAGALTAVNSLTLQPGATITLNGSVPATFRTALGLGSLATQSGTFSSAGINAVIDTGGLTLNKLAQGGATSGQAIAWNGSTWSAATVASAPTNASVNSAIATDANATKATLGTFEGYAGQTQNCLARLASNFGAPTPLRIAIWGDSLASFGGGITLGPKMAIKGWISGFGGAYSGGAAQGNGFNYWINGKHDNIPNGGSAVYQKGGSYQVAGDTIAIYYIKESGGGTFNVETSVDGTTWVAATGGTGLSAANATTIGAVFTASVSTSNNPTYRLRVTGASGAGVKVVGYGIYHTGAFGGVVFCEGLLNRSGHNLSEEITTPAAVITPILTSVAPDLVISRMADHSFQWENAGVTISASLNNGSPNITFPSVTAEGIAVGSQISGTGIPGGTTVIATNGTSTATLSANATETTTSTLSLRGAYLTMYDRIKAAAPNCDFVTISQTMADVSVDAGNDRKRANEKMRAWAEANNETFVDCTSFMGTTYTAGVANGYLESDIVGHPSAAGAWMSNFILWNHLVLGQIPLGRIPFFGQSLAVSRGATDYGLGAKTNNINEFEAQDMVTRFREVRVATGSTVAEVSSRSSDWSLSGSTTLGEAWLKAGSTNVIKLKSAVGGGLQASSDGGCNCGFPGGRFTAFFTTLNASGAVTVVPDAQTATTAAVSVLTSTTKLTTTAAGQAITLANGTEGQIKTIVHVATSGGGTAVLTPATKTGYTTITFTAMTDTVTLQYYATIGWVIIAIRGAVAS